MSTGSGAGSGAGTGVPAVHTGVSASPLAFFSFPQVTDRARHRDYNAWHQLDHLPENRALRGVVHGERWVRTPACRAASAELGLPADPTLDAAQYVALYWFAETAAGAVEPHVAEWRQLGESTRLAGRRPELDWTVRRLTGMFRPEQAVVDPQARVSAGALPFRPHRGVVLDVLRVADPGAPAAVPELIPGVAGTWTFSSVRVQPTPLAAGPSTGLTADPGPGGLRIALHYCEADPLEVVRALAPPAAGAELLLRTPLLPVLPWQWDWFDDDTTPEDTHGSA